MGNKVKGTVIFFNGVKGYGFIEYSVDSAKQPDLFVHWSDIDMDGYKILYKMQQVEFEIGKNNKGQPKAIHVKIV